MSSVISPLSLSGSIPQRFTAEPSFIADGVPLDRGGRDSEGPHDHAQEPVRQAARRGHQPSRLLPADAIGQEPECLLPRNRAAPAGRDAGFVPREHPVASDLGPWDGAPQRSDIVVIGAEGAIDADELQSVFDACRV